jgi:hypothetical protein
MIKFVFIIVQDDPREGVTESAEDEEAGKAVLVGLKNLVESEK